MAPLLVSTQFLKNYEAPPLPADAEYFAVAFSELRELDDGIGTVEEARGHRDDLSREVTERRFIHRSAQAERRITAHAAALSHGQRPTQRMFPDRHPLARGEA